ncbi:MAG: prepilin-type N-terminal cleavage/methylation domain-containing protein [Myxococcota bacterium]
MRVPKHRTRTRRLRRGAQAGFTLIELMVAMVVSAIVVLGVYAFSTIQQSTAGLHERNVKIQQALEGAMWTMAQDVRSSGLGFARLCSELRIFDQSSGRLINPGAFLDAAQSSTDAVTEEAYWVLRDGVQAHWNSSIGGSFAGDQDRSATPTSVADSFDVVLAEPAYVDSFGVFQLAETIDEDDDFITIEGSPLLDNTNPDHVAQVQQLFPPGSFFVVARTPIAATNPMRADTQGQCPLFQITGDVQPSPADNQQWQLPIDGTISGFNSDVDELIDNDQGMVDWNETSDLVVDSSIVPLGRLRWSRYEIDYTIPTLPYLVRYDIIGHRQGEDPDSLGAVDYPHCSAGTCTAAQLHLPGSDSPPAAVAVGPMIEDMQVAVGCDGYTALSAAAASPPYPNPDVGYEDLGPAEGVGVGVANLQIDENPSGNLRDADEWLGNARNEQSAPDCVFHGTADWNNAGWVGVEGDSGPPPAFRMSPQSIRITLVGSSETDEVAGGLATPLVLAVEDRAPMNSPVGTRQRFTLTEVFTPRNLRWRDPTVL